EGRLVYARQFASRRREGDHERPPSRLYVFEPVPSITGARADHRFPVRAVDVEPIARALAAMVGADVAAAEAGHDGAASGPKPQAPSEPPPGIPRATLEAIARDLKRARGRSVVVPGDFQPPAVHAIAHAINAALDNLGSTVSFGAPALFGE